MRKKDRFIIMDITSAELSKYAANSMLAARISFMNDFSRLCEKTGANIDSIRRVLGSDKRIGPEFLYSGIGYGGSCLPKDTKALLSTAREYGVQMNIVSASDRANEEQLDWFCDKITSYFGGRDGIRGKRLAFWGLSFKAMTDDVRFSPAVRLIEKLKKFDVDIVGFDPVVKDGTAVEITLCESAYDTLSGADALVVATEWNEFRSPDFPRMKSLLRSPVIFDGKNLYDASTLKEMGFTYFSVGRIGQRCGKRTTN